MVSWIYSEFNIWAGGTITGHSLFKIGEIFVIKKKSRIFENAQTFCFREEFLNFKNQNALRDEINTLVDYFWIPVSTPQKHFPWSP